jgi:Family of unknown function (DUF5372)
LGFVTITHPHHPLSGQKVEVIRLRRGSSPDVIVRLANGTHAAIAVGLTDYGRAAGESADAPLPSSLLDLDGLRELARLVDQLRQ